MTVVSGQPVKIETPKVEMGNDTGASEELWEGLGAEDKENANKGKGENVREDLVSAYYLNVIVC